MSLKFLSAEILPYKREQIEVKTGNIAKSSPS